MDIGIIIWGRLSQAEPIYGEKSLHDTVCNGSKESKSKRTLHIL